MKFASIDIGSNAIRLLFCNVYEKTGKPGLQKAELYRVPVRLGDDAFLTREISSKKVKHLLKTVKAFKLLIDVWNPIDYYACATSALREAKNNKEIVAGILEETGIEIDIIDGKTEANILFANHIEDRLDKDTNYLYIDIGGGSTELTMFSNGKMVASGSFDIGTIRLLHNMVKKSTWQNFRNWLEDNCRGRQPLAGIGSGGNINKLFKLHKRPDNEEISYRTVKELSEFLNGMSNQKRIRVLGLKPDRADVIIPATTIMLETMKTAGINSMYVPQFGLADGIVHVLYENHVAGEKARKGRKSLLESI